MVGLELGFGFGVPPEAAFGHLDSGVVLGSNQAPMAFVSSNLCPSSRKFLDKHKRVKT